MAEQTPVCAVGQKVPAFELTDTQGRVYTPANCIGPKGLLVMFICNHCPYVKAILADLVNDCHELYHIGVNAIAIMSNDILAFPEDAPAQMQHVASSAGFKFPYLFDESQSVAKAFGAVCTPDFFGYNTDFELQYRGRFDATGRHRDADKPRAPRELFDAMSQIAQTGHGPRTQQASIGCSIKWR